MSIARQISRLLLLVLFVSTSNIADATKKSPKRYPKKKKYNARGMKDYTHGCKKGKGYNCPTAQPSMSPITTTTNPSMSPTSSPTTRSPSKAPSPSDGAADVPGPFPTIGGDSGGSSPNVVRLNTPRFLLRFKIGESVGLRKRKRYLENTTSYDPSEYWISFIGETTLRFLDGGTTMNIISLNCTYATRSDNFIDANFGKGEAEGSPLSPEDIVTFIEDAFNMPDNKDTYLISINDSEDEVLKRIIDVEAFIISDSQAVEDADVVHTFEGNDNASFITGMIVGIFAVSATASVIYHRRRQKRSRENSCELSEYYNNNDSFDEDANPRNQGVEEMLSPQSSWSNRSANSLGDIALSSLNNDSDITSKCGPSSSWSVKKMTMSRLAAGATQDEFLQNGMSVENYGQSQSRKKKKKNSPIMNIKKGSELDTNLDPIVEVSSSVASSLLSQTDDKMVKGNSFIPKLLPALSVSSCPSDESNNLGCTYSPVDAPALCALSPDTLMSEDMIASTPYDTPLTAASLQVYNNVSPSSDEGSPIRKLSFATNKLSNEICSDKSSDSGVRDLLACEEMGVENVVVMSEDEAVKASLIAFVDDENKDDTKPDMEETDGDIIRRTLGFASKDDDDDEKENIPPPTSNELENVKNEKDYNATILVLGQPQNRS